jgi:prolyl oligopeptidase
VNIKSGNSCGTRGFVAVATTELLVAWLLAACAAYSPAARAAEASADDPYLWLEAVDGARALDWVRTENAKTVEVLEKDARFATYHAQALAMAEYHDRIPTPQFLHSQIYNLWQDSQQVRGLWRRTTLGDFASPASHWKTVLDLDQLATREKANWVWKGADCAQPKERRCLLCLSDGGEDAVTVREFDVEAQRFVAQGFELSVGKQDIAWEDANTLLVSREWSKGELTTVGYPFIVKRWRRGTPLATAKEIFRGTAQDGGYGVTPVTYTDGDGHQLQLIMRPLTTFEAEYYLVSAGAVRQLALPAKLELQGLVSGC